MKMVRTRQVARLGRRHYLSPIYAAAAANGIARPIWNGIKKRFSRQSGAANPTRTTNQAPTTYQHDTRSTYTRRRAPRRIRNRARRSFKQFQNNLSTTLGLKSLITNDYNTGSVPAGTQTYFDIPFLDATTMAQLFALYSSDVTPANTSYSFAQSTPPAEIMVKRYRCEIEFKNTGSGLEYIDLYYYYPRKDQSQGAAQALTDTSSSAAANAYNFGNAGTISQPAGMNFMGMTPFNVPQFVENFVIYKTRRIMLQPNQSASISQKSGNIGNQSNRDWIGMQVRRNCTTGIIMIISTEVTSGGTTVASSISYHKQQWISSYRNGGTGSRSVVTVGTGQ